MQGNNIGARAGSDSLLHLNGSIEGSLRDTSVAHLALASFGQEGYGRRSDGIDLGDDDTPTARHTESFNFRTILSRISFRKNCRYWAPRIN